jgi:16S rRNA (cytosine1402-N4)-methyltransferase
MASSGHTPVLVRQVVNLLAPAGRHRMADCTLGLGGHARALLEASGTDAHLIGMDADEGNVKVAQENLAPFRGRVRFFHANFSAIRDVLEAAELDRVDLLLADLGFASTQIDDPQRGMSFQADGPLDMRMNRDLQETAADLVNRLAADELADVIYQFGEERFSRRIARAIVEARREAPIARTGRLAEIVTDAIPPRARHSRTGIHPATRTFQALRIAVNDELTCLDALLAALPDVLTEGGRAAIISFHSLEDRRVKHAFADLARTTPSTILTKKPLTADEAEQNANPRSRSAKLRAIEFHTR